MEQTDERQKLLSVKDDLTRNILMSFDHTMKMLMGNVASWKKYMIKRWF